MLKFYFLSLALFLSFNSFEQITNGNIEPEKQKEEKPVKEKNKSSKDSLIGTNFYLGGLYQYSYRKFTDESPTGHYYDEITAQENGYSSGFNFGILVDFTDWLKMDIGLTYFGHAETYSYTDSLTDSTYAYRNNYQQLGIPLRLRFSYGEKWQIYSYVGLTPLNILKLNRDANYRDTSGNYFELNRVSFTDGFESFNLMLSVGLGLCYQMNQIGFYISPEYRRHLLNTYESKVIGMDHRMFGIGINTGMVFKF